MLQHQLIIFFLLQLYRIRVKDMLSAMILFKLSSSKAFIIYRFTSYFKLTIPDVKVPDCNNFKLYFYQDDRDSI